MAEHIEREELLEKAKELAGGVFGAPRIIAAIKNAPKADVLTENNHSIINHCPNCNEWVTVQKYLSPPKYDLYCRNCGQALDWSDTE